MLHFFQVFSFYPKASALNPKCQTPNPRPSLLLLVLGAWRFKVAGFEASSLWSFGALGLRFRINGLYTGYMRLCRLYENYVECRVYSVWRCT